MAEPSCPTLSDRIAKVLALDPAAHAMEFEHRWYSWGDLGADRGRDRAARRAGRTRRRPAAQPPAAGRSVARSAPRRRVRRHREPRARRRAGARRPRVARCRDHRRRSDRPRSACAAGALVRSATALGAVDDHRRYTGRRPDRAATGRRGRDAHERHDRSAEARPAHLRDASRVCSSAPSTTNATPDADLRLRSGVTIVNSPLVHLGGLFRILQCVNDGRVVLPAGAVPGRRVGRRRAPPPPAHGQPRPGRAAHGARRRSRPRRPRERALRRLGHRAARPRRRRRVPREVRRAGADLVRRHRVRRRRRRMEPRRPRAVLDDEARQRRARPPGLRAARRRSRHRRAARPRRGGSARGEGPAARRRRASGRARPTSHASTPTASCGSSGAPTRRSSAAGSRSGPTTCAPRSNATRACAAPPSSAVPTRASARCRSPRSSCARAATGHGRRAPRRARRKVLARYELPDELRLVDALPRTPSGKVDLAAVRELFGGESPIATERRGRSASSRCRRRSRSRRCCAASPGLVQSLEHDDPAVAPAHRRPARRRARAREPGARRSVDRGSAPTRPPTDGRTSTTRATSARTTRASPSTRSPSTAPHASGTVTFPLVFEGPPGVVHGGVLATFFDCVDPAPQLRRRRRGQDDVAAASSTGGRRRSACRSRSRSTARPTSAASRRAPGCSSTTRRCAPPRWRRSPATAPPAARLAAAGAAVSATVVDAGDGLPLTVPALLRERAARRGDHPLLICDDDVLTYADADVAIGGAGEGRCSPCGAGRGTHVGLLHPNGPEFVVGWLAAARIGAVTVPLSTFSTSAELRTLLRNADIEVLLATHVVPRPRLRRMRCAKRFPSSTSRAAAVACAICARAAPRRVRRPARRCADARVAGDRSTTTCWPRPRPRVAPVGPHGDRAHLGLDERAEGRDPPARPAHPPPRQPQRAASLHRGRGAVLELAVLLDRRLRVQPARHAARRRHARVLERDRRVRDARPARTSAADDGERVRGVGRAPRARIRRSPTRDLSSIRRGNLWPIMPAACGRPTRSCVTTCSA